MDFFSVGLGVSVAARAVRTNDAETARRACRRPQLRQTQPDFAYLANAVARVARNNDAGAAREAALVAAASTSCGRK
jgi:hypothetical protein